MTSTNTPSELEKQRDANAEEWANNFEDHFAEGDLVNLPDAKGAVKVAFVGGFNAAVVLLSKDSVSADGATDTQLTGAEFDEIAVHEAFNPFDVEQGFEGDEISFTAGARYQHQQHEETLEVVKRINHGFAEQVFELEQQLKSMNENCISLSLSDSRVWAVEQQLKVLERALRDISGKKTMTVYNHSEEFMDGANAANIQAAEISDAALAELDKETK